MDPRRIEAPLDRRMAREREQVRKDLAAPRFVPSDYAQLLEEAKRTRTRLDALQATDEARQGFDRLVRTLENVISLAQDPGAEILPPTQVDVYRACVALSRLGAIIEHLAPRSNVWRDRLLELLIHSDDEEDARIAALRFSLHFASICAKAGVRVEPGSGDVDTLKFDKWTLGIGPAHVSSADSIEWCMADITGRLKALRRPGLAILDLSDVVWPQRTVLKVGNDTTAVGEIHRLLDDCLISNYERFVNAADTDLVIGVVGCMTLGTLNASNNRLAFATNFQIATLLPAKDPRTARLQEFSRRFGRSRDR